MKYEIKKEFETLSYGEVKIELFEGYSDEKKIILKQKIEMNRLIQSDDQVPLLFDTKFFWDIELEFREYTKEHRKEMEKMLPKVKTEYEGKTSLSVSFERNEITFTLFFCEEGCSFEAFTEKVFEAFKKYANELNEEEEKPHPNLTIRLKNYLKEMKREVNSKVLNFLEKIEIINRYESESSYGNDYEIIFMYEEGEYGLMMMNGFPSEINDNDVFNFTEDELDDIGTVFAEAKILWD